MPTMTPKKIEQELLEIAMLEEGPKCDGWEDNNCPLEAEFTVTCPCGRGVAYMCTSCLAMAKEWSVSRSFGFVPHVVRFSKQCGHRASLKQCTILPI